MREGIGIDHNDPKFLPLLSAQPQLLSSLQDTAQNSITDLAPFHAMLQQDRVLCRACIPQQAVLTLRIAIHSGLPATICLFGFFFFLPVVLTQVLIDLLSLYKCPCLENEVVVTLISLHITISHFYLYCYQRALKIFQILLNIQKNLREQV